MLVIALLPGLALTACLKEEKAVAGVAKDAEKAEHKAQEAAAERDQQRAELEQIQLPTKSLYIDIHDPSQWANPFLMVGADTVGLRILLADANPSGASGVDEGEFVGRRADAQRRADRLRRPEAARRQMLQLRLSDLDAAVAAVPPDAWPYGRVIAVAESSSAVSSDRPRVRRNVEAVIRQLNNLGVVVEEWPAR